MIVLQSTLAGLSSRGYCVDEFGRWQQGGCRAYAYALTQLRPDLKVGSLDKGGHWYAHDDTWAYDSAGRHPLPYMGVEWDFQGNETGLPHEALLDDGDFDGSYYADVAAAKRHISRNRILQGRYGPHGTRGKKGKPS